MNLPLISIIIPVYNVKEYLEKCIQSVVLQTYKNLEIILVDDGSADGSGAVCDEFAQRDSRIKVIHKENGGLSDARNAGLDIASGDYIGFVDSDDYIHPDMYRLLYETISEHNADVAECSHKKILSDKSAAIRPILKTTVRVFDALGFMHEIVLKDYLNSIIVCNKLYKAERWKQLRFPVGKFTEDAYVAFDACYTAKKLAVIDAELYFYRIRPGSISNGQGMKKVDDAIEGYDYMLSRCREVISPPALEQKYSDLLLKCRQARLIDAYFEAYLCKNKAAMKKYGDMYKKDSQILKEHKFKAFNAKCFLYDIHPKVLILSYKLRNFLYRV